MSVKQLLCAENIKVSFGEQEVLDFETFRLYEGDKVGLVGANGAGKTTLLKVLCGQLEPERGSVKMDCDPFYFKQFEETCDPFELDGKEITSDKGLTFRLSQDTLIKGNRGLNDHVYELPFSLKADVESLLKINENITNYRVVGELYISDISPDGTTLPNDSDIIFTQVTTDNLPDTSLSDYFVFTIAKIKTDLDL